MSQDDPGRGASGSPTIVVNGMGDQSQEDMASNLQHYCLRWNNHRSNLLLVFQHLFQTELFTDVTLACDGMSIKCHKMVLAACSSYFQQLFLENNCAHPIVILKDITYYEMKAMLEYMYKGEVNIDQSQLPGLLKAAETLKVKGLVEDNNNQNVSGEPTSTPSSSSSGSYQPPPPPPPPSAPQSSSSSNQEHQQQHQHHHQHSRSSTPNCPSSSKAANSGGGGGGSGSSSSSRFIPESSVYESHNLLNGPSFVEMNAIPTHMWPRKPPQSPSPKHGSSSNFENEPVPLKKKRYMGGSKDTPILRTVLGHNGHHNSLVGLDAVSPNRYSPQNQMSSVNMNPYKSHHLSMTANTFLDPGEKMKTGSPVNYADDWNRSFENDKTFDETLAVDPDTKLNLTTTYVQAPQKPEWKRYKQYTRNDILEAIEAVKDGMSALQAARKYGVPSRTLYDKVKKLGITTNRPYKKGDKAGGGTNCVTSTNGKGGGVSPESHQLELNAPGPSNRRKGRVSATLQMNGMDEESSSRDHAGSEAECSVKQEQSAETDDEKDEMDHMPPDSSNRILNHHDGVMENGMETSSSVSESNAVFETEEMQLSPE